MTNRQDNRPREGARIISALETMWAAIQAQHAEVPAVVMVTGSGRPARKKAAAAAGHHSLKLGHHSPDRWRIAEEEGRLPELFVAGETIALGGPMVLETMLHEAAHALSAVRGIKGTSSQGNRWHNKKFARLAAEMGLEPPEKAHSSQGFSDCKLLEMTRAEYRGPLRRLDQARLPFLDDGTGASEAEKPKADGGAKTGGKRVAAECGCKPDARKLQITPKMLLEGPVLCGLCKERFAHPDVEVPDDDEDQDAAEVAA